VFVSRTLHPAAGFASNFSYMLWNLLIAGVYSALCHLRGGLARLNQLTREDAISWLCDRVPAG
jgi:hypothetical protein